MTNRFRFWLPSVACGKPRRYMIVINNNNHNHSIITRNGNIIYLQRTTLAISSVVGLVLKFDGGGGAAVTAEEEPKCNYETNYCPNVVSPIAVYGMSICLLRFWISDDDGVVNEWLLTNRLVERLGRPSHQSE